MRPTLAFAALTCRARTVATPSSSSPSAPQPIAVAATCAWIAFGSWDDAVEHPTEAAIFGALLAASCALASALLAAGLAWGGPWRQMPADASWEAVQVSTGGPGRTYSVSGHCRAVEGPCR